MADHLSPDPSIFGTVGQSVSSQAVSLLNGSLYELALLPHETISAPGFALEVNEQGIRQQDTGLADQLRVWQQRLEAQREQRRNAIPTQLFAADTLTGISPGAYAAGWPIAQSDTTEFGLLSDENPTANAGSGISSGSGDSLLANAESDGRGLRASDLPVTVTVARDSTSVQALKASGTKLWSVEARGGGRTTYEVAIGPNGAQADLHEQMEYVWQNGQDVSWSLEHQGNQIVFNAAGKSISYPTDDTALLNAFALLTKVDARNPSKVSSGTSMAVSIQSVNGEAVTEPITLALLKQRMKCILAALI